MFIRELNWISGEAPRESLRCRVKLRSRHREQSAAVYPEGEGAARIVFDEPQRAVTPGQAAVLYDGSIVLGGGRIVRCEKR